MKVLHFHFGKEGGAERFFATLVRSLQDRGIKQRIFMRAGRSWEKDVAASAQLYFGAYRHNSPARFFVEARVRWALREFRPDIVMAWAPQASRLLPGSAKCPTISRLGDYPLRLDYFRNTDVIIGNTPGIVERVRELGWTKSAKVISNFTSFGPCEPVSRAALDTPEGAFLVVGAGRFVHRKGFDTLIDAVAKLPDAWLWLVGDGEEREALEKQVAEAGIADRVRFAGWQANPAPYMAAANVFVMPSRHEPLGNVILEAWSVGAPIVSSRSEGPSWMMKDGENGLLADIEDAAGFANAIKRIKETPGLSQTLVNGGRATLDAQFSVDGVTDAYLKLFSDALAERQSAS